ncbi:unnamed protein product, partial [Symbiodinium pilosum]
KVFPAFVQTCDFTGLMVATICAVFAPTLALVSLVLWMRAVFLGFMQYLEPADLRRLQPNSPGSRYADESPHDLQVSTCASWSSGQVKHCQTVRCAFLLAVCVAFSGLAVMWEEYGSYEAFERELDFKWGFLLSADTGKAPVWLGEFGTNTESLWWKHMLTYLQKHDLDFAYWSINGEKYNGVDESFGLYKENFVDVRHPWKLQQLQTIMNITAASSESGGSIS